MIYIKITKEKKEKFELVSKTAFNKWVDILVCIHRKSIKNANNFVFASQIAKEIDITYSHVVKILDWMEFMEYIERQKVGRRCRIVLKSKGKEMGYLLEDAMHLVGYKIGNSSRK